MSDIAKSNTRELTRWQKLFLSFPTMPGNLSTVLIHNAFLKYYTDIIGLDPKFVGLIYALFGIWNAINDPAIGVWLDRYTYNEKRGKYVYIMRLCAPVTLFATFAMIFAQPSWNEWVTFAFLLTLLFIYDTSMTTFNIAHANFKLIVAKTNKERVDVSVFTTYVENIGGFFGTVIPTLLLVGNNDKTLTTIMFCAVLAVNSILYFIALKPLKETKEMYLKENVQNTEGNGVLGSVLTNVRDAAKSRAFITFVMFQILVVGPLGFYFTPFLYITDYVLKLEGFQATLLDLSMGITLFATAPLLGMLIKKLGIKTAITWALIPCAVGFLLLTFVHNYFEAFVAYIIMYVFAQAISIALNPMIGAIIDEDEMRTGQRKAGMFNGLNALLTIPAGGIQASIFMGIISYFGFQSGTKIQSDQALLGIKIGAGALPFVFVFLGIIPILFFPINKKKEQELSEFSKEKQIELASSEEGTASNDIDKYSHSKEDNTLFL